MNTSQCAAWKKLVLLLGRFNGGKEILAALGMRV
jgi:hypothetical protein